ncbi:MAG: Calx-beta domain-containing protein [Deltaproteobacteria bacterium]|nr:Calx-beta domain-containing protein [Deltaproteobacteria bacterium]
MNSILILAALVAGQNVLLEDAVSVGEADGTVALVITLEPQAVDVTVTLTASADTASADDFVVDTIDVVIPATETTGSAIFAISQDTLDELGETFNVVIDSAVGTGLTLTLDTAPAVVTIVDDDLPPVLSLPDLTVDEAVGQAALLVTISAVSALDVTLTIALDDLTAVSPADYLDVGDLSVLIPAGSTSATALVDVVDDNIDEPSETFHAIISSATNATINTSDDEVDVVITDNDPVPVVSLAPFSVLENAGVATIVATLTNPTTTAVTVVIDFNETGTANEPEDYDDVGDVNIVIAAGAVTGSGTVALINDTLDENDETFNANIFSASATVTVDTANDSVDVTILDDDAPPTISIASLDTGGIVDDGTANFVVTLSTASGLTVTGLVRPVSGTAIAGVDFAAADVAISISPGSLTDTANVSIVNDNLHENTETFSATLINLVNATVSVGSVTVSVPDDDTPPEVGFTANSFSFAEASGNGVISVELTEVSGRDTTVTVSLAASTAVAPADFTNTALTISIPEGELVGSASIPIDSDLLDEDDEIFVATISAASGATIDTANDQVNCTIVDDDNAPTVSVIDASVTEDATVLNVIVRLSAASGRAVSVRATTTDGTALQPADYTAASNQLVNVTPGSLEANLAITIKEDVFDEDDETFNVTITAPINTSLDDDAAVVTILDDDAPPVISVADAVVVEGGNAAFVVTIVPASGKLVSFDTATTAGTAGVADFTGLTASRTITAGVTTATVNVATINDVLDENDGEAFTLAVSNIVNASAGDLTASGSITDNDAPPVVGFLSPSFSFAEASDGTVNVGLSVVSGRDVTVTVTLAEGSALDPQDFSNATRTISIPEGQLTGSAVIPIVSDALDEDDEVFVASISTAVVATIDNNNDQVNCTILDDDDTPTVSVLDASVTEDATTLNVIVRLSAPSGRNINVRASTADGTAVQPADYTQVNNQLVTIAAGATESTLPVVIKEDVFDEDDETFAVNLTAPGNVILDDASAVITILDDDAPPVISVADLVVGENGTANFVVTIVPASGKVVSFDAATAPGTAGDADFIAVTTSRTINPTATTATVSVAIVDDATDENDGEIFTLALSAIGNATAGDISANASITDNDAPPTLAISAATVVEGDSGTATLTFPLTLSALSEREIRVTSRTTAGTAELTRDFTNQVGNVVIIPPGDGVSAVNVTVTADTVHDKLVNETLTVELSAPINVTLGNTSAAGTIVDDDPPPGISIGDATLAAEGNDNVTALVFTITLDRQSELQTQVTVAPSVAGTTASANDVVSQNSLAQVAPLTSTGTASVLVLGDTVDEADEFFDAILSGPGNGTILDGTATGTIIDDDNAPTLSIANATLDEDDGDLVFTVTLSARSGQLVLVDFASVAGTAADVVDFATTTGTASIAIGANTTTIRVPVVNDVLDELDETFVMRLSNPRNAAILDADGTGSINDNDAAPTLTVGDAAIDEGDLGNVNASFRVALSAPSGRTVTVPIRTIEGTATLDDFTLVDVSLLFPAGTTEIFVDVPVSGDRLDEGSSEAFRLDTQAGVSGATVIDSSGAGTIRDDDETPTAGDDAYSVDEEGVVTKDALEGVLANDADGDGDVLTVIVLEEPGAAGTLDLVDDGSFVFTPALDFAGDAVFTYRTTDGVNTVDATATITVNNINDAPEVDVDDIEVVRVDEDVFDSLGDALGPKLTSVTDVDPADRRGIAVIAAEDVPGGSFEVSFDDGVNWEPLGPVSAEAARVLDGTAADTRVRLVPPPNENPIVSLTFVAWDQTDGVSAGQLVDTTTRGGSSSFSDEEGTLRFDVLPINDGPELVDPTPAAPVSALEGTTLVITLAAQDSDGPDEIFTLENNTLPATAIFDAVAQTITWTPTFDEAGTYSVDVVVDDSLLQDRRTVIVTAAFIDVDSDAVPDTVETSVGVGTRTDSADSDGDTILDDEELGPDFSGLPGEAPVDSDGDAIIDALDDDSDNDGVLDVDEAGDALVNTPRVDSDDDGVVDALDDDSDDDTLLDGADNCRTVDNADQGDADGDLVGDACDEDADGDRLTDRLEAPLGLDATDPDSDNDTILDGVEAPGGAATDTNDDDVIDALDDDSDGDGLLDRDEAGDAELLTAPRDSDGDDIADFIDVDSDGDDVDDDEDNCVLTINPNQEDEDGDDVGDLCLQVCGDGRVQFGEQCEPDLDEALPCDDLCVRICKPEVCDGIDNDCDDVIDVVTGEGNEGQRSVCDEDLEVVGGGVLGLVGCSAGGGGGALWLALLGLPLLRRRRHAPLQRGRALLLMLGLVAGGAQAQEGMAVAQFMPAPAGAEDFVLVEGTGAAGHLAPAGAVTFDYGYQALQVRDGLTGAQVALLEHRLAVDVTASISLLNRFVISAGVPLALFQAAGSDDTFQPLSLAPVALGDARVAGRWSILDIKQGPGAALSTTVTLPTGDPAQLLGHGSLTVRPQLIGGWRFGEHARVTGNLGYLIRGPQKLFGLKVGNEVTFGLGGEIPVPLPTPFDDGAFSALIEVNGRVSADPALTPSPATTPLETQVAMRWAITQGHGINIGTALGITPGYGTPLLRAFVGYTFTWPTVDTDKDGVDDDVDDCPTAAEDFDGNFDEDGCAEEEPLPDPDNDNVLDPVDQCPDVPEDRDNFEDDDGCPDLDHDGDGAAEDTDKCPDSPEDRDGFEDEDGCPDDDNDHDGFKDAADKCRNAAEVRNNFQDDDGCPDVPPAAIVAPEATPTTPTTTPVEPSKPEPPPFMTTPGHIDLPQRIYFTVAGHDLTAEGKRLLDQVASTMKANQDIRVEVQGHTDGQGDDVVNDRLALRRAETIANYLVANGIDRPRLLIAILGKVEPLAPNDTPRGRALNRRVEFRVIR